MGQRGFTQNLHAIFGDGGKTAEAYHLVAEKTIDRVWFDNEDNALVVETGGNVVAFYDAGQCCCENRYMTCDDDLDQFAGAKLLSVEEREGPTEEGEYGEEHETAFLKIVTDKGDITACTHNEHNGYYGGFSIFAAVRERKSTGEDDG